MSKEELILIFIPWNHSNSWGVRGNFYGLYFFLLSRGDVISWIHWFCSFSNENNFFLICFKDVSCACGRDGGGYNTKIEPP